MTRFFEYLKAIRERALGAFLRIYLLLNGCRAGAGLRCAGLPHFRDIPKGNIRIGRRAAFGRGTVFEIARTGHLVIGDRVTVSDNVRFSSAGPITVGHDCGIAENVSIRGSFHETARDRPFAVQGNVLREVTIGRDVLLGAGTVVLPGARLPDGVIIGALSRVGPRDKLRPYGIFAGSPLRHIRDRQ